MFVFIKRFFNIVFFLHSVVTLLSTVLKPAVCMFLQQTTYCHASYKYISIWKLFKSNFTTPINSCFVSDSLQWLKLTYCHVRIHVIPTFPGTRHLIGSYYRRYLIEFIDIDQSSHLYCPGIVIIITVFYCLTDNYEIFNYGEPWRNYTEFDY